MRALDGKLNSKLEWPKRKPSIPGSAYAYLVLHAIVPSTSCNAKNLIVCTVVYPMQ